MTVPALSVRDVTKTYHRGIWPRRRALEVLKGASLEVAPGELVGLVGENGSSSGCCTATAATWTGHHAWATARRCRCCGRS